jgi:hypothetical protein
MENRILYRFLITIIISLPTLCIVPLNAFAANNNPIMCNGKQVLGKIEKVVLLDKNLLLDAKLDTGAAMASISATDIETFKRDNKDWVRFSVYSPTTHLKTTFVKPLIKYVHILKRKEENNKKMSLNDKQYGSRAVVPFLICIGDQKKIVNVNLIDRTQFLYPILLGSSTLNQFNVLVDVSQKYLTSPKCVNSVMSTT